MSSVEILLSKNWNFLLPKFHVSAKNKKAKNTFGALRKKDTYIRLAPVVPPMRKKNCKKVMTYRHIAPLDPQKHVVHCTLRPKGFKNSLHLD